MKDILTFLIMVHLYIYKIITLYTLNLYNAVYQLYLYKAREKYFKNKNTEIISIPTYKELCICHSIYYNKKSLNKQKIIDVS